MQQERLVWCLADELVRSQCASSQDEAYSVAEAVVSDGNLHEEKASPCRRLQDKPMTKEAMQSGLLDYYSQSLSTQEVQQLIDAVYREVLSDCSDDDECQETMEKDHGEELCTETDDDGDVIGEGECELCERFIQLTKHHLIPKATWPRMEATLAHAAVALAKGDESRARIKLGNGLSHFLPLLRHPSSNRKNTIRWCLGQTCDICRPCHTAVHRTHDNMTLAREHNQVEKLLEDEQICKFAKWASKQKPGKYLVRHNT